jgi:hypothetical protein
MPRINVQRKLDRVTYSYRLPDRRAMLVAWGWCVGGGAAIGVALAVGLAVAGLTVAPDESGLTFRAALLIGTVAGTLLMLALLYVPGARRVLRVTFNYVGDIVEVRFPYARIQRFNRRDVIAFRLAHDEHGARLLVMETGSTGPVILAQARREGALPQLVGQLNEQVHHDHQRPEPPR